MTVRRSLDHLNLRHICVGDRLVLVHDSSMRAAGDVVVTKVGRTYLTVDMGARFLIDGGHGDQHGGNRVYTADGLATERERRALVQECSRRWNEVSRLSVNQALQLLSWFKENV